MVAPLGFQIAPSPSPVEVAREIAARLAQVEIKKHGLFIHVPVMFPSGSYASIKIEPADTQFLVTDDGQGMREAEMIGNEQIFRRVAREVAERAGVRFDQYSIFELNVDQQQLEVAIAVIANAAKEAVDITYQRSAPSKGELAERFVGQRLQSLFGRNNVVEAPTFRGASSHSWSFDYLVTSHGRKVLFDVVSFHSNSLYPAIVKFEDVRDADETVGRVAVLSQKPVGVEYLNLMSRAANVISKDDPDSVYRSAA